MCISDGNSWERKWGENVQNGDVSRRGKGKSLLTLLHKCFWRHLFLSTGKHWMLQCVYCCVDEHLKLDFILGGSRKQNFILVNVIISKIISSKHYLIQTLFYANIIPSKHYSILGGSRKHYWGSIQREDTAFRPDSFFWLFTM